jgi:hypothetical protein
MFITRIAAKSRVFEPAEPRRRITVCTNKFLTQLSRRVRTPVSTPTGVWTRRLNEPKNDPAIRLHRGSIVSIILPTEWFVWGFYETLSTGPS